MNNFVIDTPDNFWQIRWLDKYMEGHKGFIAGGCFKNILSGEKVKDIDIFFESESNFQEAIDLFNDEKHQKEGWKFKYRNEKVCAFQKEGEKVWIEFIESEFGKPEEILRSFDFTVAKMAYYKEPKYEEKEDDYFPFSSASIVAYEYKLLYHEKFFEHLHMKRLVIDENIPFPVSTWERSYRYKGYGYNMCRETKKKLLQAIKGVNVEEEDVSLYTTGGWDQLIKHRYMNTSFEKSKNSTDEWYTPKEIIDALGEFDLDPCAPMRPLWRTARVMYNKEQDGLKQKWEGRVWLNPPYSRPTIEHFVTRMVEHNNGIALLFNRLDNKMFQDVVFPKAKGILFMKGRIKFHREDGTIGESPGCGSILVAFGEENAETLRSSNIEGRYIQVNQEPCNTHVDWEQRRYEMAKTMLPITSVSGRGPHGELILEACDKAAELAVIYADALIKELK